MKIVIISELSQTTVNYGNHLQAYALNRFLRERYHTECVQSVELISRKHWKYTNIFTKDYFQILINFVQHRFKSNKKNATQDNNVLEKRLQKFEQFRIAHFPDGITQMDRAEMEKSQFDVYIVGSDVVWMQNACRVNKTKFLDFAFSRVIKRISYAASFGGSEISSTNVPYIRKCLKQFDAISVREHISVATLEEIGIRDVAYCLDPTLLLTRKEWMQLEEVPAEVTEDERFIFVYLFGEDIQQRVNIADFADREGLKIVYIPNANGVVSEADADLNGIGLNDCSIENWIWLVHHAEYVITNSFHGSVFSTIFNKKFVILKDRTEDGYMTCNRMVDYLSEIDQKDKMIISKDVRKIKNFIWDYSSVNARIETRRQNSISYLDEAIGEKNG